jgi:hypothetical protein
MWTCKRLVGKFLENLAGSTDRCNTGLKFTRRSFKAQGFPRGLEFLFVDGARSERMAVFREFGNSRVDSRWISAQLRA